jgi:hypothetical protein
VQNAPDVAEDEVVATGKGLQSLDKSRAKGNGHGVSLAVKPGG